MRGRVIAFDPGERRIGVAVSDPTGTIAQVRGAVRRDGESWPWRALLAAIEEAGAQVIVVGHPLLLDGTEGEAARRTRAFADELARRTSLPVHLEDERLTTAEAEDKLRAAGGGARRPEEVDAAAAAILLQDWLDAGSGRGGGA